MRCGLLGEKLGHSYSPLIHSMLGNYKYELFEKQPKELENFLKYGEFSGINVTIPYKKAVISYLDDLSPVARRLGAVNTIVRRPDGTLIGHNTDYFGFRSMVEESGLRPAGKKVLVLGTGGASATVQAVMAELGAIVVVISRSGEDNYDNLLRHTDAAILVNATPVGMYPNNGDSPVNLDQFPQLDGVLDLIYNPTRTRLLLDAEQRGLIARNGLWMLVAQAKESAEWFTGTPIDDEIIEKIHRKIRFSTENIILIGMPGCGKSAIGRALSQQLPHRFVDADAEIIATASKSIPEIFAEGGEPAFREIESDVLKTLGKCSGHIIATGGGCVTRSENYEPLHQNGTIFWLQRPIDDLPTEGRPLSQSGSLQEMYTKRSPLYAHFSDYAVQNDGSLSDTVHKILNILEKEL
jgi:shikimate dehydrogenase